MSLFFSKGIFNRTLVTARRAFLVVAVMAMLSLSATPLLAQRGFGRGHGFGGGGHGFIGRGHSYTRFGFGGSYYRPYYRPYRSFDFFFGSGWGPYYGYYPYYSYYPYYPPAYYGPVYGYPPDPPSYRITYGDATPRGASHEQTAWLNLNVQPEEASVYIDGQFAGRAADFGRNKKLLTVTPTDHTLRFEAPGYQPVVVDLRINPLQTMDINQRLQPASSSSTAPAPRVERMTPTTRQPYSATQTQSVAQDEPPTSPVNPDETGVPNAAPNADAVGFGRITLKFATTMDNAAVYIDGKFIGVSDPEDPEFMVNDVPPGNHHVVVTRPGYVDFEGNVGVKSGGSGTVNVVMQKASKM